jgi:hypothetical protein
MADPTSAPARLSVDEIVAADGHGPVSFPDGIVVQGTPTAPTAAPGTGSTQLATTAFVQAAIAAALAGLPVPDLVALLRDDFTTAHAAPLPSPRTAEPGPGTAVITAPSDDATIAGGVLIFSDAGLLSGTVVYAMDDLVAGLALFATLTEPNGPDWGNMTNSIGWRDGSNPQVWGDGMRGGMSLANGHITRVDVANNGFGGSGNDIYRAITGFGRQALVVRAGAGLFHLARFGSAWELLFVTNRGTNTHGDVVYAHMNAGHAAAVAQIAVGRLSSAWRDAYTIADTRLTTTVDGSTLAIPDGDGFIEWTFVYATGTLYELQWRRSDSANYWCHRALANGNIEMGKVVAGVFTPTYQDSGYFVDGVTQTILVRLRGTVVDIYQQQDGGTYSLNDSSDFHDEDTFAFNQAATGVRVNATGTNLIAWPRDVTALMPEGV